MKLMQILFRPRKQNGGAPKQEGFAIAPILYLLGLIGVGAGVLFSGYSQILRSNQTITNTMTSKNDLQGTATTLAASSWLSTDQTVLCPPMVGSGYPTAASARCSGASGAITVGTAMSGATAANLPSSSGGSTAAQIQSYVASTGSPVEVGVFKAGSGAKVLDPWGHYYVYCRWENSIGTASAFMVISGGANGKVETKCGDTVAGGDDVFVVWTTAVTQNRAAVWQTTTTGTTVTGTTFGAAGTQLIIDTAGDVTVPGTLQVNGAGGTTLGTGGLTVTGPAQMQGGVSGTTGAFSSTVSGASGSFTGAVSGSSANFGSGPITAGTANLANTNVSGNHSVIGLSTLGQVSAGSSTLSNLTVSGASALNGASYFGGTLNTSTAIVQIGTTVVASGSSTPLLTVGKPTGSPASYAFMADQLGTVKATTFNGSLNGSQSGGSVSASTLAASGATTLSSTLAVTGATNLTGQLNGGAAVFTGNVAAQTFTGAMTIGGSGVTLSGTVPITNGGTGQTTASAALSGLFSGAGTISQMIPGADLVNNSIGSTQLSVTGITAGSYSQVTVGADGRIYSGTSSGQSALQISDGTGDSVTVGTSTGIVYSIGSSTVGNWTSTGLMVGSSKTALDKLDVYGGVAIGSSYAGTTAAPVNGLSVQGQVSIGTTTANGALNVNGTIFANNFSGSGAGLTSIGTTSLAGTVSPGSGGTGTSTIFTQGSVVYSGAGGVYSQDNANFFYDGTNHRLGLGTAAPQTNFAVNGSSAFLFGTDYATVGPQADVSLGNTSSVRYNGATAATFYGILAGANGQIVHLHNASTGTLTLSNSSPSESNTNNQILTGTGNDITLQSNSSVILQYDSIALKWRVIGGSGGGGAGLAGQAAYFQSNGSTVVGTSSMYFVNGNVGVGTNNPAALMHVNGTLHLTGVSGGIGTSTGTGIVGGTSGQVQFNNGTTFAGDPALYWDNTNKFLGVGTSVPQYPLHVVGSLATVADNAWSAHYGISYGSSYFTAFRGMKARGSLAAPAAVQAGDELASFDGTGYDTTGYNTVAGALQIFANSTWGSATSSRSGYLTLSTTNAGTAYERMRIDSSGNVGIGTTAPGAVLHAYTAGAGTYTAQFDTAASSTGGVFIDVPGSGNIRLIPNAANSSYNPLVQAGDALLSFTGGAPTTTGNLVIAPWSASAVGMRMTSAGYVGIGTVSPSTALQVNGTVTATTFNGSGAGLTNLPASALPALTGDVTSSAGSNVTTVAKIQGTTVSGTTGTGNVVFSNAPVLTGYVGIGTTVPIRTLTDSGELAMTTNGTSYINISDASGSNGGNMSLDIRGLGSNGGAEVAMSKLILNAAATYLTGSVGIGTNAPNSNLDVRGNIAFGPTANGAVANQGILATDGSGASVRLSAPASAGVFLQAGSTGKMDVSPTNTCEAGSILCVGSSNIGIGNVGPVFPLDVNGTIHTTSALIMGDNSAANGMHITNDGNASGLKVWSGAYGSGTLRAEISDNGTVYLANSVGIGVTSPAAKLHIANGTAFNPTANVTSAIYAEGNYGGGLVFKDTGFIGLWSTGNGQILNFGTNGTTSGIASQMVLNNGSLGIGNTSPTLAGLQVDRVVGSTSAMFGTGIPGLSIITNWPGLYFNGYYNSGAFFMGSGYAGQMNFNPTNGDMYFTSSNATGTAGGAVTFNSAYTLYLKQNGYVGIGMTPTSYQLDVNGATRTAGQFISNINGAQFRGVDSNYGYFHYSDGTNYYFLLTNSGNQYGGYNGLRPFYINESSGLVTMGNGAVISNGLTVNSGGVTVTGTVTATTFSGSGSGLTGIPATSLSNGTTGSGAIVLANSPTIATPTITGNLVVGGTGAFSGLGAIIGTGVSQGLYVDGSNVAIRPPSGGATYIQNNGGGTTYMYVQNGGKVGINTTNPLALLSVNGAALIGPQQYPRSTSGLTISFNDTATYAANSDMSDNNRMLNIVNEGSTANSYASLSMRANPNGGANDILLDQKLVTYNNGTGALIYTYLANNAWSDVMALTSTGTLGIGITSPNPSYKLDVSGDIHATGWLRTDGNQGWYSQTYGGGWYMTDSTWIRSYNNKPMFESAGFDTGAASGVNCGGGMGNGYTFDVCGTANVTGNITTGGSFVGAFNNGHVFLGTDPGWGEQYAYESVGVLSSNNLRLQASSTNAVLQMVGGNTITSATTGAYGINGTTTISTGSNNDGIVFYLPTDNQNTIQTYIDGHWSDRTTYGGPCCNQLNIEPDAGNVVIGNSKAGGGITLNGNTGANFQIDAGSNYIYAGELYTRDNVYLSYLGDWISNRLGQDVRSGSSPNFWNPYIGYMSANLNSWLNQNVSTGASPTFAGMTNNGNLTISGQISQTGPGRTTTISTANYDARFGSNDLYFYFKSITGGSATAGALQFMRISDGATSWPMLLNPNGGSVGVNLTTAPTQPLEVNGNAKLDGNYLYISSGGGGIYGDGGNIVAQMPSGGNFYMANVGTDGTKVSQSNGSLRVGGPSQTGASLNVYNGSTLWGYNQMSTTGIGECCASYYTLALSEDTVNNGRWPWLQFLASGQAEAYLRMKGDRVFEMGDDQSVGTSLAILNKAATARNLQMTGTGNSYINGGNLGIYTSTPAQALEVNGNAQVDGNVYCGSCGNWLGSWINQNVQSGSSPNFWNPYIGYMGTNLSNWVSQGVTSGNAPTFAGLYVPWINVGNGSDYAQLELRSNQNGFAYIDFSLNSSQDFNWRQAADRSNNMYFQYADGNNNLVLRSDGSTYVRNYFNVGGAQYNNDGNMYIPYIGDWLSNRLNQDVRNGASPSWWQMTASSMIYANGGVTQNRSPIWLAGAGDCNHAIFNNSNTPCGFNAPSGNNDSEVFDYWGGLAFIARNNGNNVAYFNASGVFTVFNDLYANNFYHNSDRNLKDNIKPIKGLDIIEKLNGVTFNWKEGGLPSAGVIAQDVQAVMPESVHKTDKGFLAVNTDTLFAPVIEAIKDLKKMFDELSAKVATLFTRVDKHDEELKSMREELDALHQEFKAYKAAHP